MGLLDRFRFGRKAVDPLAVWAEMLRAGTTTKAGVTVTLDSAFRVAVLFACLRVISEDLAKVPFKLFAGVQEPAREHPLYDLMSVGPNDWSTSFEFRETLGLHVGLGNGYAFINRSGNRILELILLNPAKVAVEQKPDWSLVYKVTGADGREQEFPPEAIWHVRGPSWSGFQGMDILSIAREALGLAMATEASHSKLHDKGVRPSGLYSVDATLNKDQYAALKKWINENNAGAESGSVMVLDRAAKFVSTAMTGVDAQHMETRKFQIEEICRFMRVNPQKVFHTDKTATHASAEEFNNAHREDTIGVWYARIEQSADKHLLTPKERKAGLYFKFVANALMRATAQARAEYYARALGSGGHPGWMTPDEVRALEEMAPKGGEADKLPAGANNEPEPPEIAPKQAENTP